jgi:hypothetical protein
MDVHPSGLRHGKELLLNHSIDISLNEQVVWDREVV